MSVAPDALPTPSRKHSKLLLLLLPLLVAVAIAVNWTNVKAIAAGQKSLRSVIYGVGAKPAMELLGWRMPSDTGEPGAKVTVEVFLLGGDPCHADTMLLGRALGTVDPKRLRVRFMDVGNPAIGKGRMEKLKLGCDQGLAVNGKTKVVLPDPAQPGKTRTVYLNHKADGMSPDVLYAAFDRELKAVYHGKGMAMSKEAFSQQLPSEIKRWEIIERAKAEARQAGKDKQAGPPTP